MIWYILSVFCAIFLNSSLSSIFGVTKITTVSFMPFFLLILKDFCLKKIQFSFKQNKHAIILILFGFFIIIYKLVLGQNYFKYILTLLIIPMLISIYLNNVSFFKIKILRFFLDSFFVLNCLVAILERITYQHFFYIPTDDIVARRLLNEEAWEFRSHALLGHPLANAMVIAVIISFVVISNSTNIKKYFFLLLGLTSLLCFNARGATMVTVIFIGSYFFLQQYKKQKIRYKPIFIGFFLFGVIVIFYQIFNTDLGGRLVHADKIIDGSAQTRLDVYQFYLYLSKAELLWGSPNNYLYLTDKLGAGGVENGVIVFIIDIGLIFAPILLLLLFNFQRNILKKYKKIDKWLILITFYLIGYMNPNLAEPIQWIIFIFAFYAYSNVLNKNSLKFKHH